LLTGFNASAKTVVPFVEAVVAAAIVCPPLLENQPPLAGAAAQ
jgi:hypothetical protein